MPGDDDKKKVPARDASKASASLAANTARFMAITKQTILSNTQSMAQIMALLKKHQLEEKYKNSLVDYKARAIALNASWSKSIEDEIFQKNKTTREKVSQFLKDGFIEQVIDILHRTTSNSYERGAATIFWFLELEPLLRVKIVTALQSHYAKPLTDDNKIGLAKILIEDTRLLPLFAEAFEENNPDFIKDLVTRMLLHPGRGLLKAFIMMEQHLYIENQVIEILREYYFDPQHSVSDTDKQALLKYFERDDDPGINLIKKVFGAEAVEEILASRLLSKLTMS